MRHLTSENLLSQPLPHTSPRPLEQKQGLLVIEWSLVLPHRTVVTVANTFMDPLRTTHSSAVCH